MERGDGEGCYAVRRWCVERSECRTCYNATEGGGTASGARQRSHSSTTIRGGGATAVRGVHTATPTTVPRGFVG